MRIVSIPPLKRLLRRLDPHTREVLQKSAASAFVKFIGMGVGLVISVFLARVLGASGLGIINLSNRIIQVLLVIAMFGTNQVIIREIAISHRKRDMRNIRNIMFSSYVFNGTISIILTLCLVILAPRISQNVFNDSRLTWPLIIAGSMILPQVISRIIASGLVGFKKIWQSNLVDRTLSASITGLILLVLHFQEYDITIVSVAIAYAIGRIVVTLTMILYWKILFNDKGRRDLQIKPLLKSSMPLLISNISIVLVSNLGVLILAWNSESTQVGLYTVALRLALLTKVVLNIVGPAISPTIAILYKEKKIDELERLIQKVTLGLTTIAIISILIFIFLGKNILGIWGQEFTNAYGILVILALGQFINLISGICGQVLVMTGFEKIQRNISLVFLAVNIVLVFLLTIAFGIMGAALASALTIGGINITRLIFVHLKVKINSVGWYRWFSLK